MLVMDATRSRTSLVGGAGLFRDTSQHTKSRPAIVLPSSPLPSSLHHRRSMFVFVQDQRLLESISLSIKTPSGPPVLKSCTLFHPQPSRIVMTLPQCYVSACLLGAVLWRFALLSKTSAILCCFPVVFYCYVRLLAWYLGSRSTLVSPSSCASWSESLCPLASLAKTATTL